MTAVNSGLCPHCTHSIRRHRFWRGCNAMLSLGHNSEKEELKVKCGCKAVNRARPKEDKL